MNQFTFSLPFPCERTDRWELKCELIDQWEGQSLNYDPEESESPMRPEITIIIDSKDSLHSLIEIVQICLATDQDLLFFYDMQEKPCYEDWKALSNRREALIWLSEKLALLSNPLIFQWLEETIQLDTSIPALPFTPLPEDNQIISQMDKDLSISNSSNVQVALINDTRGLLSSRHIHQGEHVVSLPEEAIMHVRSTLLDKEFASVTIFLLTPSSRESIVRNIVKNNYSDSKVRNHITTLYGRILNTQFSEDWALILYLLHCWNRFNHQEQFSLSSSENRAVLFYNLIRLLPRHCETALTAAPEVIESINRALPHLNLDEEVQKKRDSLYDEYGLLFPLFSILFPSLFEDDTAFTWERVLFANDLITSRAMSIEILRFDGKLLTILPPPAEEEVAATDNSDDLPFFPLLSKEGEKEKEKMIVEQTVTSPYSSKKLTVRTGLSVRCLVPVGDIMNHRILAPVAPPAYDEGKNEVFFSALCGIEANTPLTLCYARMQSYQSLFYYGFVSKDETQLNTLPLEYEVPEDDSLSVPQMLLLSRFPYPQQHLLRSNGKRPCSSFFRPHFRVLLDSCEELDTTSTEERFIYDVCLPRPREISVRQMLKLLLQSVAAPIQTEIDYLVRQRDEISPPWFFRSEFANNAITCLEAYVNIIHQNLKPLEEFI